MFECCNLAFKYKIDVVSVNKTAPKVWVCLFYFSLDELLKGALLMRPLNAINLFGVILLVYHQPTQPPLKLFPISIALKIVNPYHCESSGFAKKSLGLKFTSESIRPPEVTFFRYKVVLIHVRAQNFPRTDFFETLPARRK